MKKDLKSPNKPLCKHPHIALHFILFAWKESKKWEKYAVSQRVCFIPTKTTHMIIL